jgi:hypothetical protein
MNVTIIGFERLEETDNDFTDRSNCNRLPLLARHVANTWVQMYRKLYLSQRMLILILIYLLTAIGLTPGGSSTVHIYAQTIHRRKQLTTLVGGLSEILNQSGRTKINDELSIPYAYLF